MSDNEIEITPLDFLEAVYLNPDLPLPTRMRAAIEAAPYKHPKLSAHAHTTYDQSFAVRLELAIERSKQPQLLNGPTTIEHEELVTRDDLKKPFQRTYRRFISPR
jgi:hypothetical protein